MSDLMWRATFRSLPTGTFAQGAKVPHGAGIRLSVPSAELSRKFSIFGQGGPEGTPFNFFASAKKFFYSGGSAGFAGFWRWKKFGARGSGTKKKYKTVSRRKDCTERTNRPFCTGLGGCVSSVKLFFYRKRTRSVRFGFWGLSVVFTLLTKTFIYYTV